MMHNNQLWGVCLEECTVKSCGIKKDIRSWHCQESQPFCTKKSNEDAAVVQPVKRKVNRPWIWPLARRPEGQPSDTSFHMSLRKWSIRKVVIIKKPTQKKSIVDAMTERKFTRGLNKPGMAAQLRENISQVVRESASLVCIFLLFLNSWFATSDFFFCWKLLISGVWVSSSLALRVIELLSVFFLLCNKWSVLGSYFFRYFSSHSKLFLKQHQASDLF